MSPESILLVRQSWAALTPRASAVAAAFYDHLFRLDPAVRQLFARTDLDAQRGKLIGSLALVVRALDDPEQLVPPLASLGRRHQGYGVSDRHYDLVGEALLATLRQELEASWSAPLHDAWAEAYTLIASIMKRAGARASGAVPLVAG